MVVNEDKLYGLFKKINYNSIGHMNEGFYFYLILGLYSDIDQHSVMAPN